MIKLTYKQSIFGYFFIIFALFTTGIIFLERDAERKYKEEALESKLDGYAEIVNSYIQKNNISNEDNLGLKQLSEILPQDIRLTIINNEGTVLFDKNVENYSSIENHLDRPEIRKSLFHAYGTNIRTSATKHQPFLYYAKHYTNYYIRVALPYNIQTQGMLKANNLFVYITLILFVVVMILLNYVAGRFGKSIQQLKKFIIDIKQDKPISQNITFPHDELGSIGKELVAIVEQKENGKKALENEREKLIQHFQYSGEGLGIFSKDFKKIYANTHFIQYVNFIIDSATVNIDSLFSDELFSPVYKFLIAKDNKEHFFAFQLSKNGKTFLIQAVVFEDKSFELTIKDITKTEKNRILKQEMTSNIAHELRTPLTSIRGYLETLEIKNLSEEKQKLFIDKAYKQSLRLSLLIDDISLISKMEESSSSFVKEKVNLLQVINSARIDLSDKLQAKSMKMFISVPEDLSINANYSLIYSLFKNLIDNSIAYAGDNADIFISNYMKDDNYIYFSYYDTGVGVDEQHLNRLFERFYRINEGRDRETGGSGLGLSIVKNSIILHKGEIQAKNRQEGGLQFLFSLHR